MYYALHPRYTNGFLPLPKLTKPALMPKYL
jgi:hypothetical protein